MMESIPPSRSVDGIWYPDGGSKTFKCRQYWNDRWVMESLRLRISTVDWNSRIFRTWSRKMSARSESNGMDFKHWEAKSWETEVLSMHVIVSRNVPNVSYWHMGIPFETNWVIWAHGSTLRLILLAQPTVPSRAGASKTPLKYMVEWSWKDLLRSRFNEACMGVLHSQGAGGPLRDGSFFSGSTPRTSAKMTWKSEIVEVARCNKANCCQCLIRVFHDKGWKLEGGPDCREVQESTNNWLPWLPNFIVVTQSYRYLEQEDILKLSKAFKAQVYQEYLKIFRCCYK